jgi:hypothetical protein
VLLVLHPVQSNAGEATDAQTTYAVPVGIWYEMN